MTHRLLLTIALVALVPAVAQAQESAAGKAADPLRASLCVAGDPMPVGSVGDGGAALPAPAPAAVTPVPIPNVCDVAAAPGTVVRIRGTNPLAGRPLYVVDGLVVKVSDGGVDPIKAMDPGDIQSITVLKDRSATAQYGPEGQNGVVIVETRAKSSPSPRP